MGSDILIELTCVFRNDTIYTNVRILQMVRNMYIMQLYRHECLCMYETFMGGNLAYGAVPVASSRAVIPKLHTSAFSL